MSMEELNYCPFCGETAKIMVREKQFLGWRDDGLKVKRYFLYAVCKTCHSRGKPIATNPSSVEPVDVNGKFRKWVLPYVEKAIAAWNRRAGR